MPYMDGFEATRRIRAMEERRNGNRTPIIAMTAYAMKGDREKCLDSGMDGYLPKPVNSRELATVIDNVTSNLCISQTPCTPDTQEESVLDLTGLLHTVGGNRELMGEMLAIFSEDSPKLLADIASAIANCDHDALRIAAHSLKSMVAGLGASVASEAALRLECMGRSLDMTYAQETFGILSGELSKVQEALHEYGGDTDS
jgi:CheY-like chemotaxis protein